MKPVIDSRKLLAFQTLAKCGSFTQAARELFLTQSAVSHAIRGLEEELGVRLFERRGRIALLTPAGNKLLLHTEQILTQMSHARSELAAMPKA